MRHSASSYVIPLIGCTHSPQFSPVFWRNLRIACSTHFCDNAPHPAAHGGGAGHPGGAGEQRSRFAMADDQAIVVGPPRRHPDIRLAEELPHLATVPGNVPPARFAADASHQAARLELAQRDDRRPDGAARRAPAAERALGDSAQRPPAQLSRLEAEARGDPEHDEPRVDSQRLEDLDRRRAQVGGQRNPLVQRRALACTAGLPLGVFGAERSQRHGRSSISRRLLLAVVKDARGRVGRHLPRRSRRRSRHFTPVFRRQTSPPVNLSGEAPTNPPFVVYVTLDAHNTTHGIPRITRVRKIHNFWYHLLTMPRNTPRNTLVVTFKLEPDLLAKFDAIAERESRTRTSLLIWMMKREIALDAASAAPAPMRPSQDATAVA